MLLSSYSPNFVEAGVDEVGRGCLAGPVVAACVILPKNYFHPKLNDSKKLNQKDRYLIKDDIENHALDYAVAEVCNLKIDEINILNAAILTMHHALGKLKILPELILVDGNKFKPFVHIPHQCVVKGDEKYYSIAAASILAKCFRDDLMKNLAKTHRHYGWEHNMGYPTVKHRQGIEIHGFTHLHRQTFRLLKDSTI